MLRAALVAAVAGCSGADAGEHERAVEYRPDAGVERLTSIALAGDDIGLVQDFDMTHDTIYLLERTGRVVIVERTGTGWRLARSFGRSGGGPGEFLMPTGIALAGDGIAVIDGTRLQFFSRSGELRALKLLSLPCAMMLPAVTASRTGVFVHGACMRSAYATDTVKAMLAWSPDTATWTVIAEAVRYTRDGRTGSIFGASRLLTPGPSDRHVFGGGEMNCIWHVDDAPDLPLAAESCPVAGALYSADPPPGVEARLRRGMPGMNVRWPESLPVYMDRFVTAKGVVLLRPFTADSIVLQSGAPISLDIAVAPLNGLIGCKTAGCVWVLEDELTPHMIVLERASVEARLMAAETR